jgi:hypothetical protein
MVRKIGRSDKCRLNLSAEGDGEKVGALDVVWGQRAMVHWEGHWEGAMKEAKNKGKRVLVLSPINVVRA